MIKKIIFDMDGTLSDTAKVTIKAFQKYALKFNFPQLPEETIKQAIGYADPEFYLILYPDQDKNKLLEFAHYVDAYEKILIRELAEDLLFENVRNLLDFLKEAELKLYIASTGSTTHVESVLSNTRIIDYFDGIYCGEKEKVLMVKQIINETSLNEWVMVGDKQKDADAARYNQILSIGAGYGYCTPDDYHLFDKIIHRPFDLLKLINQIQQCISLY